MSQVEFLKLASSLIPELSGKSENLQSFVNALSLVDSLKVTHKTTAVSLIKTKLKGHVRNLINTEQTIEIEANIEETLEAAEFQT